MVTATRSRSRPARSPGLELDLVDREAEVVQPADPGRDREPVVGAELDLGVELVPEVAVPVRTLSAAPIASSMSSGRPVDGEVGQPEGDVLDEDLEVVRALAVGQARMDLARLGVDEIGLDLVAVTPEEGVRQRAVAPVDAAPMEVDEERRHRVEEPVAVDDRPGRQPHQEPPVLERLVEVGGQQDRLGPVGRLGEADRRHRRELGRLEPAEDLVLASGRSRGAPP